MLADIYKRIGTNSIYTLIRRGITFPIGIILVPLIIKFVGVEGYGVWIMTQAFLTYTSVMDLGLSPAVTKYTAEFHAQKDNLQVSQIFNTVFIMYLCVSVLLLIAVFFCKGYIIDILIRPVKTPKETVSFVLIVTTMIFCFNMLVSIIPSFLNGLQRMDVTNKIDSVASLCKFGFSVLFLFSGGGLKGLAVAGGISSIITMILYFFACRRVASFLHFDPFLFRIKTVKKIWGFSSYGALGNMVAMVHLHLDKLIVNYIAGVHFLAFYDIAHRLVFFMWGLCGSFIAPVMPAVSSIHASNGMETTREVFQKIFKFLSLIVCPLFLFVSVFADNIIVAWLGNGYEHAVTVLRILSIAYMINIFSGPATSVLTGIGLYKITFYGGVIASVATVILCPILTITFGIVGNAIGILFAFVISDIFLFTQLQKPFASASIFRVLYDSLKFPTIISVVIFIISNTLIEYFFTNKYIILICAVSSLLIAYCLLFCKEGRYRTVWKSISAVRL